MTDAPTKELLQLLERLDLATADQVAVIAPRVRRLAKGLPLFESVWIDALSQAGRLTPYQAQELKVGRGEQLRINDYVLQRSCGSPAYLKMFTARAIGAPKTVRLAIADVQTVDIVEAERQLQKLVETGRSIDDQRLLWVQAAGIEADQNGTRIWAVCDDVDGISAAEWMVPNGRFPADAVLPIAQQMTEALTSLEHFDLLHADLAAVNVLLDDSGVVRLLMPGLRAILRPEEGYGHTELQPEAYENVAPERILHGLPPSTSSDMYACGCLWWHLLAGRPPIRGGDSLTKLRNAQRGRVADIRQLAPDVPEQLADAIAECMAMDPINRETSFASLARQLGSASRKDQQRISDCVNDFRNPKVSFHDPTRSHFRLSSLSKATGVTALIATAIVLAVFGYDHFRTADLPVANLPAPRVGSAVPTGTDESRARAGGTPAPAATPREAYRDTNIVRLDATDGVRGRLPKLRPGMTVQADPADRARFVIPAEGLSISEPHIRFENIDFIWTPRPDESRVGPQAMIQLNSHWVEFYRCSFQAAETSLGAAQPIAIACAADSSRTTQGDDLRHCHVMLDECVVRRVSAAVEMSGGGAIFLEAVGTLHLGAGPFVRLNYYPGRDQPVELLLRNFTLRGATALVDCRYDRASNISISSINSVFAPQVDGALLAFDGAQSPAPLIRLASWRGQGSLLAESIPIAKWTSADGPRAALKGDEIPVDGLSRCQFEFAGPQVEVPEASRVVRWTAPLRSADPPGIDAASLSLPDPSDARP